MAVEIDTTGNVFSPEGVGLTLIRWFLTLTPEERLDQLQEAVNSLAEIRESLTDA
jgi:hypothetical protein